MGKNFDFASIRNDVNKALEQVGKKYQLSIKAADIKYNENSFTLKLDCTRTDIDVEKAEFERNAKIMGFLSSDYKAEVTIKGEKYILYGFKPGCKYSIKLRRVSDGANYEYQYDYIRSLLGR